jgi:hypothetical protein
LKSLDDIGIKEEDEMEEAEIEELITLLFKVP